MRLQKIEERPRRQFVVGNRFELRHRRLGRRPFPHLGIGIAEQVLPENHVRAVGQLEDIIQPRQMIPVQCALRVVVLLDHRQSCRIADIGISRPAHLPLQDQFLERDDDILAQRTGIKRLLVHRRKVSFRLHLEAARVKSPVRHGD